LLSPARGPQRLRCSIESLRTKTSAIIAPASV
jgi:hypothetical protein